MPAAKTPSLPFILLSGEDDFSLKQRAKAIFQTWRDESGGFDQEIIEASASNTSEALKALARLREALMTLPFFGAAKVIWFQNCNFLGEERTSSVNAVLESLQSLAQEMKSMDWKGVKLLITAPKVDKRRAFFKTIQNLGTVEDYPAWSLDDREWALKVETAALEMLRAAAKEISEPALARLVQYVGPNRRQLANEIEKLSIYVGDRREIAESDVATIVTRNRQGQAFATAEALATRNLARMLPVLEEELWQMKTETSNPEIPLLYGIISRVRQLLLIKELVHEGILKPEANFARFRAQLETASKSALPPDKRFNPLLGHPYMVFLGLQQIKNYTAAELARAMELLLDCNLRLVTSGAEPKLALQQTLIAIAAKN